MKSHGVVPFILALGMCCTAAADIRLQLHGCARLAPQLGPLLAQGFLEDQGFSEITVAAIADGELAISGYRRAGSAREFAQIAIVARGAAAGFRALAAGDADVVVASRAIDSGERKQLTVLGDMQSHGAEYTLGLDGLAVIVHPDNPVRTLTRAQITRLFSGAINRWSELGGSDRAVVLYARRAQAGSADEIEPLLAGRAAGIRLKRLQSGAQVATAVAADPAAVGLVPFAEVGAARALAVGDRFAQKLVPSAFTIATEDYALARRLYLYMPPIRQSANARAFIEFTQSERGQGIVAAAGLTPQAITAASAPMPPAAPEFYRELQRSGQRLSVNFRFHRQSKDLDNKARRDIERLGIFLQRPEMQGQRLYLVGFAARSDSDRREQTIAHFYAVSVRNALQQRNMTVAGVIGVGAELPVTADSAADADRNGRVEVWIAPPLDMALFKSRNRSP